jgi:hypothetical protein
MTVANTDRSVTAQGNDITTEWPFSFNMPSADSVNVVTTVVATGIQTVIAAADYTVTGLNDPNGGTITYPTVASGAPPLTSATEITIYRNVPQTQLVTVSNQTRYDAKVVEPVWDRLTMMIQDLVGSAAKSLHFPEGDTAIAELPAAAFRANKFLAFNVSGDVTAETPAAIGAVIVSSLTPAPLTGTPSSGTSDEVSRADHDHGTVTSLNGGQLAGHRNILINGNFPIWQRGITATISATEAYLADMWKVQSTGTVLATASRSGVLGAYRHKIQRTAGDTAINLCVLATTVRTINCAHLAGQTVTISFLAKAGANYSPASSRLSTRLVEGGGVDEVCPAIGGFPTLVTTNAYNPIISTTEERYSTQVTLDATTTQLALHFWYEPTGTAGADDWFEVGEVQIELGSVATPFEHRLNEFELCQPYCCMTYSYGTYPGVVTNNGAFIVRGQAVNSIAGALSFKWRYPAEMIYAPTITVYATDTGTSGSLTDTVIGDVAATASFIGSAGCRLANAGTIDLTATTFQKLHAVAEAGL